jgi:hypothetical protein
VPESMVGSGWPLWNCSQIEAELCHLGAATPERGMLTGDPSLTPLEPYPGSFSPPEQGGQGSEGMIDWRRRGARLIRPWHWRCWSQSRTAPRQFVFPNVRLADGLNFVRRFLDPVKSVSLPLGGVPHFRSNGFRMSGRQQNLETLDCRFFF